MITILNGIQPKIHYLERINQIYDLIKKIKDEIKDIPDGLQKTFIYILVSTLYLNQKSIFQRLLTFEESIENIYIPFVIDSDEILYIK